MSDFSIDIRGDKEFQAKLKRFRQTGASKKLLKGIGQDTMNHIKLKEVRAGAGTAPNKITRHTGGGSATTPVMNIEGSHTLRVGAPSQPRAGSKMTKGQIMAFHERGGYIQAKAKRKPLRFKIGNRWISKYRVRIPARPTYTRTKEWLKMTLPGKAEKFYRTAIQAAGLK